MADTERMSVTSIRTIFFRDLFNFAALTLVVQLARVPGSPRRTRRRLPGIPGSKKKNHNFFFFKMINGNDSDILW